MKKTLWLFCLLFSVSTLADSPLQPLQAWLSSLNTLQANFQQTVYNEKQQVIDSSDGHFYLRKPGAFHWYYKTPYEQRIISDGATLWIYDIDLDQVTIKPMDDSLSGTPAMIFSNPAQLEKTFTVTSITAYGTDNWLLLTPKKESGIEQLKIATDQGRIQKMVIIDQLGQTTELTFKSLQENPSLDASLFQFKPPQGVDVIDQTQHEQRAN